MGAPLPAGLVCRLYQRVLKHDIYDAWASPGVMNVMAVLPTGGGKTFTFADIIHEHNGPSVAIAHRQELVGQISMALAREGVRHRIIGSKKAVKHCISLHMEELGRSYYDPSAKAAVAGVDTLVKRKDCPVTMRWARSVTLWVQDEAHHVLEVNKWGQAAEFFPNAKGLGVTATPCRADGKGLGRWADGLFDVMVEGPTMRELINLGYLTDYRVIAPLARDLDLSDVPKTASGELSGAKLKTAIRRSKMVGDVVEHYLRFAPGKLGVTFATDVETAEDIAAKFNARGVPAAVIHAKTPDDERVSLLRKFARRELMQLVNVDLFGEGFDLPAIEVVSMARPTESLSLFCQQFGRALRILIGDDLKRIWEDLTPAQRRGHIAASTKPKAIILDHVGNVENHKVPDVPRIWTLDARDKRGGSGRPRDEIPNRTCLNTKCFGVYPRTKAHCPHCGHTPVPSRRTAPEYVDGDLYELDPEVLARMRGEVIDLDEPYRPHYGLPQAAVYANAKRHARNIEHQEALREAMAWWCGIQKRDGADQREAHRRFYHIFNIDILSAQALKAADALVLADKIAWRIGEEM